MDESLEEFELRLEELFAEEEVDEDSLLEEILLIILLLFAFGAGYEGVDDLTQNDREWLDDMYQMSVAAVPGIADRRSRDVDMAGTITRLKHHVSGAYQYAYMAVGMGDEELYTWELGEAEHCGDCIGYANLGPMPGGFWQRVAVDRNHYPQSPHLECKGLHCPCHMEPANA